MALLDLATQVKIVVGDFGSGLDHPECVAWGQDGYAYAGGEAGQIYRVDLSDGSFEEIANIGGFVGGMALDAAHNIYVCCGTIQRVTPTGQVSTYSTGTVEAPLRVPNYPAFDQQGNLYVSDSGEWKKDNGCLYKIQPGGKTEVWCRELSQFPNGICLSPQGDYLYVVMSLNTPRIARVKIAEDGSAGACETVVELPQTVPDGVAFDAAGALYISCYRPDRIYRLTTAGQLDILAEDFEGTAIACPTNIAFCGADREMFLSANLGRWHLTQYDVGVQGISLHYPQL